MTFNMRQLAGVLLIAVAFLDLNVPSGPTVPDVVIPKPSITVVIPEVQDERKAVLADFYLALGEIVLEDGERSDPQLGDTAAFAQMHASALQFAIKRKDVGTVPGLAEAVDKAFFDNLGEEVQPLDSATRRKLSEVCNAIAWSIKNA